MNFYSDVLRINPMCQIKNHDMRVVFGTYVYSINGFIDLDGSCGMNSTFIFRMKDKSFEMTFSSRKKLNIVNGKCFPLHDIYYRNNEIFCEEEG